MKDDVGYKIVSGCISLISWILLTAVVVIVWSSDWTILGKIGMTILEYLLWMSSILMTAVKFEANERSEENKEKEKPSE